MLLVSGSWDTVESIRARTIYQLNRSALSHERIIEDQRQPDEIV